MKYTVGFLIGLAVAFLAVRYLAEKRASAANGSPVLDAEAPRTS